MPSFVPSQESSLPVAISQPVSVRCIRGFGVQIRLNAATGEPTRRVDFLIRDQPKHGRLGEIVPVPGDNDVAVVTYVCDAPEGVVEDRFTYGARVWPGRVSAPVDVTIEIIEPVPVLEMVQEVNFGRVMMGMEVKRDLEIRNTGLKAYEETIVLPEPWRAGENGRVSVRIEPGQAERVPIYFRPDRTGKFQEKQALMLDGEAMIYLVGEGVVPFSIDQREIRLSWDGETGKRMGSIWIRDMMGADQQLAIEGGGRLEYERQIGLPRNQSVELVVSIPEGDVAPLSETIRIASLPYLESAKIVADATPALLEIRSLDEPEFHFGFVPEGVERSHTFVVRNRGGVPAPVKVQVSQGYVLKDGLENFLLRPGEEKGLTVAMETDSLGAKSGLFTILGAGREFRIALSGTVIASAEGAETREIAEAGMSRAFVTDDYGEGLVNSAPDGVREADGSGEVSDEDFWAPFFTIDWEERKYVEEVPSVREIFQSRISPYELEVYWEHLQEGLTYVLEFEAMWLDPESQELKRIWVPVDGVEFQEVDNQIHARVGDLQPGSQYVMRVLAMNSLGEVSPTSMFAVAMTPPVTPTDWRRILVIVGIALLFVLVGIRLWRAYQGRVQPMVPVKLTRHVESQSA
ncbi:MAG: hypothetical protein AAGD22_14180 [Verrucomicrobiota bacterium]